jgi:hypothetical protein
MIKRSTIAASLSVLAVGASAGSAFAGELTGNGKPTPIRTTANSVCAFSGQNDNPTNPLDIPDAGGHSQSYGQLVRLGVVANFFDATPATFNPGDTCRGGSN